MDLFRNIPNNHFGYLACYPRRFSFLTTPGEIYCTDLVESVRIVSDGAIPISAWMFCVHHGVGLYASGVVAARILNETSPI